MALLDTTDTLVSEVRSLINELNKDSLDDDRDIIPALNRAQDHMISILSKHYPEPYLVPHEVDVVAGRAEYPIPENAWSDKVTKIEMLSNNKNYRYEVDRANYRDATKFRSDSKPNTPYYYTIRGRYVELIPAPSGVYDMIMWYVRAPEPLVPVQGRIVLVDAPNNRLKVDSLGSGISVVNDELESWINIVDGQTGEIKATCHIKDTSGTQDLVIKSSTSSTFLNRSITTDLTQVTDQDGNLNIQEGDYICNIKGTCVPYFFQPGRNFVISHAAADCGRAVGIPSDSMYREREKFEQEIKDTWTGREARLRIKNKSPHWSTQRFVSRFRR